jgi:hypothetical protein
MRSVKSNDDNICAQIQTFLFDKETKREWYMWALSVRSTSSQLDMKISNTSDNSVKKTESADMTEKEG